MTGKTYVKMLKVLLRLCKEALDEEAQKLLEAVASSNLRLAVKQDCNDHEEEDGSWWRCF